jgi:hypothetical protein
MAALTGTQISVTYVGLLKTSANTVLSSTAQQMTDGSGNNSILYLSTAEVGIGGSPTAGKELDVTGNVLITGDLQVDNINIDGNTISATSGVVTLQDGTIATTQSQSDNSTKVATTAYVDAAVTAEDLDFAGGSGTGSVDLDSQTFTIAGTTNEIETSASGQTLTIGLPDDVTVTGELTVSGTGQSSFGGQVTIPATPSATTDAASKGYVDSQVGANNELSEVLANGNTTGGTDIAVSAGDDITFADDSKVIFGASSDLQIYHNTLDGVNEGLILNSTNNLRLVNTADNSDVTIQTDNGSGSITNYLIANGFSGAVELYHYGTKKFQTTSTGVQVTGSNLSVLAGSGATKLQFVQTDGNWKIEAGGGTNQLVIHSESLVADYVTIKGGGVVQLNDYGSGSNTGTAAYNLSVDSSGNIIETAGGVVDGSGTANDVAMWSDSNTLTDAPIAISGNNATFAGNVNIENASTPLLTIKDTTNNVNILIGADDNNTFLRGSSGSLILQTNGANAALTLDASQNATFAGTIAVGGATPTTNAIEINGADGTSYVFFKSAAATTGARVGLNGDDLRVFNQQAAGELHLGTNGATKLTIDSSGNVGIGGSPAQKLHIASGHIRIDSGYALLWDDSHERIEQSDGHLEFFVNNGQAMTLNTNGLGIGVTSFSSTLSLQNSQSTAANNTTTGSIFQALSPNSGIFMRNRGASAGIGGANYSTQLFTDSGAGNFEIYNIASSADLVFGTNATERMRIDSSGNVTIGNFTPGNPSRLNVRGTGTYNTTFSRPGATVQIISDELTNDTWSPVLNIANVRQSLTTGKDSFGGIGFSTIDDSNNNGIYDAARIALINEAPSSVLTPTSLAFYTNIGTTNSTSATEKMRIDSNGNFGFGAVAENSAGTWRNFRFSSLSAFGRANVSAVDGGIGTNFKFETDNSETRLVATSASRIFFNNDVINFQNAGADSAGSNITWNTRMRIDSAGNIFATNSSNNLVLGNSATGGIYIGGGNSNTNLISFQVGSAERMRIDTNSYSRFSNSGSYGFGSAYNFHEFANNNGGEPVAVFYQFAGSGSHYGINVINGDDENDTTSRFFMGQGGSTERIKIFSNGNIQNSNNSYGQLSDIKLKENVVDATPKLDDLMQVQIKNFNYIDDDTKQIGVIAQELEEVFPALIYETPDTEYQEVDKTDEEGNIIYQTEEVLVSEAVEGQDAIEWEDKPTMDNTKVEIQTWLDDNEIEWQSADTKQELLDKIPEYQQEAVEAQDAVYETRETDEPVTENKEVDLGTTTKAVKYSVFVPIMIKAMQEQQQIIEDLKARIETLEN